MDPFFLEKGTLVTGTLFSSDNDYVISRDIGVVDMALLPSFLPQIPTPTHQYIRPWQSLAPKSEKIY